MTNSAQARTRHGCMFYAGIAALVFFVLVLMGALVGYLTLRKAVNTWTDVGPMQLPSAEVTADQAKSIQQRVDSFKQSVAAGTPTGPLVLSAREINGLIEHSAEFAQLKGKVHVELQDGRARGQVSIPLDQTGIDALKGRFLNGAGAIRMRFEDGRLHLALDDVTVKGKPLPNTLMQRVRSVNFAQKLNEDPKSAAFIGKLEKIEVHGDSILLDSKR